MTACLSIAMATRNSEVFVSEALASIAPSLGTSGLSYEVLLADGQSEDRTVEIAAAHANVRVVSRSDHGIYDGMNRAIAAARGEFLLILNSDDLLLPNGLSRMVASLRANPKADCATGRVLIGSAATAATELTNQRAISVEGILFGVPVINARLLRVRSVARLGLFRTDIGLGADRDWLLRAVRLGLHGTDVDCPVYFYRSHAHSATLAGGVRNRQRIYSSDIALARALLADSTLGREGGHSRQSVSGTSSLEDDCARRPRSTWSCASSTPERGLGARCPRGLWLHRRWRGIGSGH